MVQSAECERHKVILNNSLGFLPMSAFNHARSSLSKLVLLVALIGLIAGCKESEETSQSEPLTVAKLEDPATIAKVTNFCGNCHPIPSPSSFPRANWPAEVDRGFKFYEESNRTDLEEPVYGDVLRYFQSQAPEELDIPRAEAFPVVASSVAFTPSAMLAADAPSSLTAHVVWEADKQAILFTDMTTGKIRRWKPESSESFASAAATDTVMLDDTSIIAEGKNLCRIGVVDWNGDGVNDYILGEIGSTIISDLKLGNISLAIGNKDGSVQRYVLAEKLARSIAGVPFDYDADGDLDILVAEFGWNKSGGFSLLRNNSVPDCPPEQLKFDYEVIDPRHGVLAIELADMNADGKMDIVTAYGQEYETIEVFYNQGAGKYNHEQLVRMPDPSYNSSSMRIVDIDKDGRLDIVHTCGDIFDSFIPKPFHGARIIRQLEGGRFERVELGMLIGAMQSAVADFDNDGDLDISAVGLFPGVDNNKFSFDSVVWWEQTAPMKFTRHSIEKNHCLHATCEAADVDGDGRTDLVVGEWKEGKVAGALRIYWNRPAGVSTASVHDTNASTAAVN